MKPRVVIDTQVWLDWLHFDDPRCAGLEQAYREGAIEPCIDLPCREEALRVFAYPAFGLDAEAQRALLRRLDERAVMLEWPAGGNTRSTPRCRDPDDQKFVELAIACGSRVLLSRDLALLALHRRLLRDFAVSVVPADRLLDALAKAASTPSQPAHRTPPWN